MWLTRCQVEPSPVFIIERIIPLNVPLYALINYWFGIGLSPEDFD